ncbi:MAG: hypothetical protein ACYST3_01980 [Planctomycetota bacterium]|jgi:hypothetical protein
MLIEPKHFGSGYKPEPARLLYRVVFLECSDRVIALTRIITDDALHIPGQDSHITTI